MLRLTSALDHEVFKPLWWRLVMLKENPANNFHPFALPAMQKACLKYQHTSTTVWLWWLNLVVILASLVIPAYCSCVGCSVILGHFHAVLPGWHWTSVFVPVLKDLYLWLQPQLHEAADEIPVDFSRAWHFPLVASFMPVFIHLCFCAQLSSLTLPPSLILKDDKGV